MNSPYNHPLETWDVRSVTNFGSMFYDSDFNQPINKWCVVNHEIEPDSFAEGSPLLAENKPVWGTCPEGTSIEFDDMSTQITLYQNYPNPFNPSTTISFGLPESAVVDLRVFDMLGREVATLINNQQQSAGHHSVRFETDAEALSSGLYVYRLVAQPSAGEAFIQTRMMLLVK